MSFHRPQGRPLYRLTLLALQTLTALLAMFALTACGPQWLEKGDMLAQQGDWVGALRAYRAAAKRDRHSADARSKVETATQQVVTLRLEQSQRALASKDAREACRRLDQAARLRYADPAVQAQGKQIRAVVGDQVESLVWDQHYRQGLEAATALRTCPDGAEMAAPLEANARRAWLAVAQIEADKAKRAHHLGTEYVQRSLAAWLSGDARARESAASLRARLAAEAGLRVRLDSHGDPAAVTRVLDRVREAVADAPIALGRTLKRPNVRARLQLISPRIEQRETVETGRQRYVQRVVQIDNPAWLEASRRAAQAGAEQRAAVANQRKASRQARHQQAALQQFGRARYQPAEATAQRLQGVLMRAEALWRAARDRAAQSSHAQRAAQKNQRAALEAAAGVVNAEQADRPRRQAALQAELVGGRRERELLALATALRPADKGLAETLKAAQKVRACAIGLRHPAAVQVQRLRAAIGRDGLQAAARARVTAHERYVLAARQEGLATQRLAQGAQGLVSRQRRQRPLGPDDNRALKPLAQMVAQTARRRRNVAKALTTRRGVLLKAADGFLRDRSNLEATLTALVGALGRRRGCPTQVLAGLKRGAAKLSRVPLSAIDRAVRELRAANTQTNRRQRSLAQASGQLRKRAQALIARLGTIGVAPSPAEVAALKRAAQGARAQRDDIARQSQEANRRLDALGRQRQGLALQARRSEARRQAAAQAVAQWTGALRQRQDRLRRLPRQIPKEIWAVFTYPIRKVMRWVTGRARLTTRTTFGGSDPRTDALTTRVETQDRAHRAYPRPPISENPLVFPKDDDTLIDEADLGLGDAMTGTLLGLLAKLHDTRVREATAPKQRSEKRLRLLLGVWLVAPIKAQSPLIAALRRFDLPDLKILRP